MSAEFDRVAVYLEDASSNHVIYHWAVGLLLKLSERTKV